MEQLDIYDYTGQVTGRTIARKEERNLRDGEYFLIVHVCLFDSHGRLLIQQRNKSNKRDPLNGRWDVTVAGHVHSGETSQAAAEREAWEEMGIRLDLQGQPPLMRLRFVPGFDDIYIVHKDLDINALRLQASEVDAARWVTRAEALEMVRNRTFLPYIESFIASLFDMRKTNGFMRDDD